MSAPDVLSQVSEPIVVERGAHERVWERVSYEPAPDGRLVPHKHRYTEVATGMHYQDANGQWAESKEQIDLLPNGQGAAAQQGQHKALFPPNLYNGHIELNTVDGMWLRSQVMGLSYYDTSSGKSVLIAELKDSVGELQPPNVVVYADAFTDFKADVRYTYTRSGFEQDIILYQQPPAPEDFGLPSATTKLQVLTEFFDSPTPEVRAQKGDDVNLDFGLMQMQQGKAFALGDEEQTISVTKQWAQLEGRNFLVEGVTVEDIAPVLQTLPMAEPLARKPASSSPRYLVSNQRRLPAPKLVARRENQSMKIAQATPVSHGLVLDYVTVNTSQTNFTFAGNTTYFISGNVNLNGTNTTFEGGAVLKYNGGAAYTVTVKTPATWTADAYRPIVILNKNDDSAGEQISTSTGNPGTGYFAGNALLFNSTNSVKLQYLRVSNAKIAVAISGSSNNVLSHVQFRYCGKGIATTNADFSLRNALFVNVSTNFSGSSSTGRVEHLTSHFANWLNNDIGTNLFLTNCLLVSVTNLGSVFTNTVYSTNGTGVFQTAYGGKHYLATNSLYRNLGTTNINASLLAALRTKTTYPPVVYSNALITTTNLTLGVQATRDTNAAPDIGFHYDPLDYAFGGCTNAGDITFSSGTAVGWFRTSMGFSHGGFGIFLNEQKSVTFDGRPDALDYLVECNTTQEDGNDNWYGLGGLSGAASYASNAPSITARSTHFSRLGGGWSNFIREDNGKLKTTATDCSFWNSSIGQYADALHLTNCCFVRANVYATGNDTNILQLTMRNCTMRNGILDVEHWSGTSWPVSIRDCAFDGTSITTSLNSTSDTNIVDFSYNAFIQGATRLSPTNSHDVLVTNFNWQIGASGNFYLPTNSALINAGSLPRASGLQGTQRRNWSGRH